MNANAIKYELSDKVRGVGYPNSQEAVETLSANTIVKWSVAPQAAFERANRNAGRKCVRGVGDEAELLSENPWRKFTWIEGHDREIRQFDGMELLSLLDYLASHWLDLTVASLVAKVFLWSWGRKSEVMSLRWDSLREIGDEYHFETTGKWAIVKWFRVPDSLYRDLWAIKTDSPFLFAAYDRQLREFYGRGSRPWLAQKVSEEFNPTNLGDWFYERIKEWSEILPNGSACIHVFRKTTLQYARSGEDVNLRVAADARLGRGVMMTSYERESDEEMRQASNRTYQRIVASLSPEVARRYGYVPPQRDLLAENLQEAVAVGNWALVERISAKLAKRQQDKHAG